MVQARRVLFGRKPPSASRPAISTYWQPRRCVMAAVESTTAVTSEMLEVAQLLADVAAAVTTPLFRAKVETDIKADDTPVTEADREAERRMREMVHERLPSHSVFGEEFGYEPGDGEVLSRTDRAR
jgi:hypothetical protein